ncbi:hypothetical protein HY213_03665 [Candidatus Peregrinibacteria bacterium]|nr:hypothetical protein [Candidatus Peregrinibacteria bacterium]
MPPSRSVRLLLIVCSFFCLIPFASATFYHTDPLSGGGSRTFIAFLNRFIAMPKGWTITVNNGTAIFDAAGRRHCTLSLFDTAECDYTKLGQRVSKTWAAAGKTPDSSVQFVRIGGVQGAAFTWTEPGGAAGEEQHWCVVPLHVVRGSEIIARKDDALSVRVIQSTLLAQLIVAERRSGR